MIRYVETRGVQVSAKIFFVLYAAALLVLRMLFCNYFDKISFPVFIGTSSICAVISMGFLFHMQSNWEMVLAAICTAGGYGVMCTVSQSAAILTAGPENRSMANSTYYIGMNSGMALGPMIGGLLYGNMPIHLFYPVLMLTVPLSILLFRWSKKVIQN